MTLLVFVVLARHTVTTAGLLNSLPLVEDKKCQQSALLNTQPCGLWTFRNDSTWPNKIRHPSTQVGAYYLPSR